MTHTFIDEALGVQISGVEIENVLAFAMSQTLGFRSPTKAYSSWLERFEKLPYHEYALVINKLAQLGYKI
ncbi:TPA: hypothetical protein ACQ0F8_002044 [Streptococcus agalactiae]|nr:hypothetical protein [Streptococcus agalactiae]